MIEQERDTLLRIRLSTAAGCIVALAWQHSSPAGGTGGMKTGITR